MLQATDSATQDLLKRLPVNGSTGNGAGLLEAYEFSGRAHGGKLRPSGEPYQEHGLAVAQIIAELKIDDTEALLAALLHDVFLPHTAQSEDAVARRFGSPVVQLIRGMNNLDSFSERASRQQPVDTLEAHGSRDTLEAIRRAILSIIEGDIRIILLRMADCLQDLRTADRLDQTRRKQIAFQAMHIYAPLANRLGIWHLKWQLEDLAFGYLQPEQFQNIARRLDQDRNRRAAQIDQAARKLELQLKDMGLKAVVTGRSKHVFSIYRKMLRKQLDLEQIYDIEALRVILEPPDPAAYQKKSAKARDDEDRSLCYQALGAVHSLWQPVPREFDDYIASPKANGYKSLHTAVIDAATGQKLEVQIRTLRMHDEAERGIAAHWAYKEDGMRVSASVQKRIQNLRELLAALQEMEDAPEGDALLDVDRLEERVYVFTPNGDVVDLPAGSTPIDFAFQIHTSIGYRCRGARVNGKMVSLDYKLNSGETVEIITAKRGGPNRDWMNPALGYTGSARTRSKIRQWFRQQEREQNIQFGREVVERELRRLGLGDTYSVADIAAALKYDNVDDCMAKVGFGDIQTNQLAGAIALMQHNLRSEDAELLPLLQPKPKAKGLTVRGVGGLHTKMAGCCNPIAPEPIIGYVTRGQGVTIHRQDCKQLDSITDRERLIEVDWGGNQNTHQVPIVITAPERAGLIEGIVNVLRSQQINVPRTKTVTDDGIMTISLAVEVADLEQLQQLLTRFANLPGVIEARRQRWV